MLTLGSKLNRLYTLSIPFNDSSCEIGIIFNKYNSFIGFNLDSKNYHASREDKIKSNIFQQLSKSAFAMTFLDLRDYQSKTLDIRQQFHNILPQFHSQIQYETNETIKLSKVQVGDKTFESCIYIYILKFIDYKDDFLFCLAERQHIDLTMNKKIVRTSAIQLSTNQAEEDLTCLVEKYNKEFIKKEDISTISNIFEDKSSINGSLLNEI